MSIELMARIWPQFITPTGRKMVLLAFADAANSDGITWIALASERGKLDMRTKCSMSDRALQGHVAALEADGYLERQETRGKGCLWRVHATPAKSAGVPLDTPAEFAPPPAEFAGEPSSNRHLEPKPGARLSNEIEKCPLSGRPMPAGLTSEQWAGFLDMRASLAKPVRPYVATLLLAKLGTYAKMGWHPGDVVDRSTVNAWPDLYEPEAGRVTGVRRVVAGKVTEPEGMTAEERKEAARIAAIEDVGEMLRQRRAFMQRIDRRTSAEPLEEVAAQLPLRPPVGGKRT